MNAHEFLDAAKNTLEGMYAAKSEESKTMFDGFTKAQDVWARLQSGHGGILETVEALGLQAEYNQYKKDLEKHFESGNSFEASFEIEGFVNFCKQQVEENFYLFK